MSANKTIKLINELDGREYDIPAGFGEKIEKLIADVYKKLKRERKPDDKLYCRSNKNSVFDSAGLTFKEYIEQDICSDLVWKFAGEAGGA